MRNKIEFFTANGNKTSQFAEFAEWFRDELNIDIKVNENGHDITFMWKEMCNGPDYWAIFMKMKELRLLNYINSVEFK